MQHELVITRTSHSKVPRSSASTAQRLRQSQTNILLLTLPSDKITEDLDCCWTWHEAMDPSARRDSEKSTIDPRDLPPKDSYGILLMQSQPNNLNNISNNNNNNVKPRAQLGGATPMSAPSLIRPSSINNMASSTTSSGAHFHGIPSMLPVSSHQLSLSHHRDQHQMSGILHSAGFIKSNVAPDPLNAVSLPFCWHRLIYHTFSNNKELQIARFVVVLD